MKKAAAARGVVYLVRFQTAVFHKKAQQRGKYNESIKI